MRITIMGQAAFGAKVLETLADRGEQVIAAWLPQGKAGAKPDPLQSAAEGRGIPAYRPESYKSPETLRTFQALNADLMIMAFVTDIIPRTLIEAPLAGGDLLPPLAPPPPPRRERDQLGRDHGRQGDGALDLLGGRRDRHGTGPPPEAGPHRTGGHHRIALFQPPLSPRRRGDRGVRRSDQGGTGAPSRPGRDPRHL